MKGKIEELWPDNTSPMIIAGPCSAESEEQLREVSEALASRGVKIIRAGVWKPRTRPNTFEGMGSVALGWIENIKKDLDVQFAIEVASAQHVELALKAGVDVLWLGARTTVNPFTVQEIADSLKGVDIPVFVKNPINPDIALWTGAMERLNNAGVVKLGAIHRGFSLYRKSDYRNEPIWRLAIDFRHSMPRIPMICDPSHIAGNRKLIQPISQKALDLNYQGLMIEVHNNPDKALSDAKQQITPDTLDDILASLQTKATTSSNALFASKLDRLREKIDETDHELINIIKNRMDIVEEIGLYKKENKVTIFQPGRWDEIIKTRTEWADKMGLREEFIEDIFKVIHAESIKGQTSASNVVNR